MARAPEAPITNVDRKELTGFSILYLPRPDGSVELEALADGEPAISAVLGRDRLDEAHILYMEATELLHSRAKIGQEHAEIRKALEQLFALYRGEKPAHVPASKQEVSRDIKANPGKELEIEVDGVRYLRLPVRTRLITMDDHDLLPLLEEYTKPHLQPGDVLYVSEKALTVTQGRVVDLSDIHPSSLARLIGRNVDIRYGTSDFHGFGHGTSLAMQLLIEEAGYSRVVLAAAVAAVTRPLGIKGMFYRICGTAAKSIDLPMSFLILEYAHAAKLAPSDPAGAAKRYKGALGCECVILDSNYRGAFSLGKTTSAISEKFIGKVFRDNPMGQSDEMTPFCIVRKA